MLWVLHHCDHNLILTTTIQWSCLQIAPASQSEDYVFGAQGKTHSNNEKQAWV